MAPPVNDYTGAVPTNGYGQPPANGYGTNGNGGNGQPAARTGRAYRSTEPAAEDYGAPAIEPTSGRVDPDGTAGSPPPGYRRARYPAVEHSQPEAARPEYGPAAAAPPGYGQPEYVEPRYGRVGYGQPAEPDAADFPPAEPAPPAGYRSGGRTGSLRSRLAGQVVPEPATRPLPPGYPQPEAPASAMPYSAVPGSAPAGRRAARSAPLPPEPTEYAAAMPTTGFVLPAAGSAQRYAEPDDQAYPDEAAYPEQTYPEQEYEQPGAPPARRSPRRYPRRVDPPLSSVPYSGVPSAAPMSSSGPRPPGAGSPVPDPTAYLPTAPTTGSRRPAAAEPAPVETDRTQPMRVEPVRVEPGWVAVPTQGVAGAAPPTSARPMSARPMSARPASARPMSARPASARPASARPADDAADDEYDEYDDAIDPLDEPEPGPDLPFNGRHPGLLDPSGRRSGLRKIDRSGAGGPAAPGGLYGSSAARQVSAPPPAAMTSSAAPRSAMTGAAASRAAMAGPVAAGGAVAPPIRGVEPVETFGDDEESAEQMPDGGYKSAAIATFGWYAAPALAYVAWAFALGNSARPGCVAPNGSPCLSPRAEALNDLATNFPLIAVAFALSVVIAVLLRWSTTGWRPLAVGFASAVVGGGATTVLITTFGGT